MQNTKLAVLLSLALAVPGALFGAGSSGSGGSSGGYTRPASSDKSTSSSGSGSKDSKAQSDNVGPTVDIGSAVVVDSKKYDHGKAIFRGQTTLPEPSEERLPHQTKRLRALQDQLPARVRETVDLTKLAGRLSPEQMESLEYFLEFRYDILLSTEP